MTTDFDSVDYFTDPSLVPDPHPYFDHIRTKNAACCPINNGVLAVTGWEAANAVYKDTESYSSCVAVAGPFTPIPFTPEGDDICAQLEEHRAEIPMYEHMVTMDPPYHTDARSLLSRLLTPKRLKENEDFMWRLADRHIDEFIDDGKCEFLAAYGRPFSLLVVADLLGVPEEDHEEFREAFGAQRPGTNIGGLDHEPISANPLEWADEKFSHYIEDRRKNPRDDVLTGLATALYPDGSTPEVVDVVRTATFLFGAGQETTAKLLSSALRVLGDRPDIQQQLREDRSLIPIFIEECLRMDSPVKSVFRMARKIHDAWRHRRPRGHHGDGQPGRRQPRSEPVRVPARVPARPKERPRAHRVQPRHPLLPRCAARPRRGPGQHRADSRPDERHHHRRGEARPRRLTGVQLRAHVHPARPHRDQHQVHPDSVSH